MDKDFGGENCYICSMGNKAKIVEMTLGSVAILVVVACVYAINIIVDIGLWLQRIVQSKVLLPMTDRLEELNNMVENK